MSVAGSCPSHFVGGCRHAVLDGALPVLQAAEKHDLIHELSGVVPARLVEWIKRIDGERLMFMNLPPRQLQFTVTAPTMVDSSSCGGLDSGEPWV